MKRFRIQKLMAAAVVFCAAAVAASAQKYNNGLIDKTIAVVGNEFIMLSELEEEMKAQGFGYMSDKTGRCELLENMKNEICEYYISDERIHAHAKAFESLGVCGYERISDYLRAAADAAGERSIEPLWLSAYCRATQPASRYFWASPGSHTKRPSAWAEGSSNSSGR